MKTELSIILSIETSGSTCGVALSYGENITCEYSMFRGNQHDKFLSEFIRRILEDNDSSIEDIEAVALSSGPGSFTGLRIGASVAKGLCFENKPKLIAVPTLSSIAYNALSEAKQLGKKGIIPIIRSHKDLIYFQKFDDHGKPEIEIIHESISNFNKIDTHDYLICGPGADLIDKVNISREKNTLSASHVAHLAFQMFLKNIFTNPTDFEPLYVQEFQPKTSRKKLDLKNI